MWPQSQWPQMTIDENDPKFKNAISLKQIDFIYQKLKELFKDKERFNSAFEQAKAKIDEKNHGEAAQALDVTPSKLVLTLEISERELAKSRVCSRTRN